MRNEIFLDLLIQGFEDITHDEITKLLGINPVKIGIKGKKRNPKNVNSPLIAVNSWFMGSGVDKYASFDEHMNSLLSFIESKSDIFSKLCKKYHCVFICAFYIYFENDESMPWVHLDERYNQIIKELNIEFDLDLYIRPNN